MDNDRKLEMHKNASIEDIVTGKVIPPKEDTIETFAGIFERAKIDNYNLYNARYQNDGKVDSRKSIYRDFKYLSPKDNSRKN